MKTSKFFLALCFATTAFSGSSLAQLKVDSIGAVIVSKGIKSSGMNYVTFTDGSSGYTGINSMITPNTGSSIPFVALGGSTYSSTSNFTPSIGVYGSAGNGYSGCNYGVYGYLAGSNNGAGVFGTTRGSVIISGKYAGYFYGDLKVTGVATVTSLTITSDARLKENIAKLKVSSALENVLQMNPVMYNYKRQKSSKSFGLDSLNQSAVSTEDSLLSSKKHYGLLAQELQAIYPDLVYEDAQGYLSIDYIGLIPVLIGAIKDLKGQVEELQNTSAVNAISADIKSVLGSSSEASISQNIPNPFSESTVIKFYLPSSVKEAYLMIYDMQGKQLKRYDISQRGSGAQVVSANEFQPGLYLYGLLADGKDVGVKRMILTK